MSGCAQMVVYGVLVLVLVLDVHKWWYICSIRVWRMRRRRRNSVYYVRECMTIPHPHVYYSAGPSLRRSYPLCVFPWLPGLHKLWYPVVRDRSTWSKFGAHGERGDVFGELCSGLALGEPWSGSRRTVLWPSENRALALREASLHLLMFK